MNRILVIILLLTAAENGLCQSGIKGGLNWATLGGDAENINMKNDFHLGLFFTLKNTEKSDYQIEMLFSRQGFKASYDTIRTKVLYDYINIPFLMNFHPLPNLKLQFGAQVGFLFLSSYSINDIKYQSNYPINNFDFSLVTGFTYTTGNINMGLRYNHGLTNSGTNSDNYFPNRVLQLFVGASVFDQLFK